MLKSKGVVHHIRIHEGKFLVAFPKYAGWFQTDDPAVQEKIRQAHQEGESSPSRLTATSKSLHLMEIEEAYRKSLSSLPFPGQVVIGIESAVDEGKLRLAPCRPADGPCPQFFPNQQE